MNRYDTLAQLQLRTGEIIGVSDWILLDQAKIEGFAAVTGDAQWIHLDAARAAAGPFGTRIAHGLLTLSLLPAMARSAYHIVELRMSVNYGFNRVRFPAPVPSGSRVRGHFKLVSFEPIAEGAQVLAQVSIEREGHVKPVCVAESVARYYV